MYTGQAKLSKLIVDALEYEDTNLNKLCKDISLELLSINRLKIVSKKESDLTIKI